MQQTQQRILLVIEYDGTPYSGWQRQQGQTSVQQTLEEALQQITGCSVASLKMACAGRTDAGVHARGQRVSFVTEDMREPRRFAPALNHVLPLGIRVHQAHAVPDAFNVREAARGKWYCYRVHSGAHPSALEMRRSWHVRRHLNTALMQQAANLLVGEHDFNSFRSVHCDAAHARRRIHAVRIASEPCPPIGTGVQIHFIGNAFCRHMCRILAGTLVEVGAGTRPLAAIDAALQARKRQTAGITAPPWGLTLMDIAYAGQPQPPWLAAALASRDAPR